MSDDTPDIRTAEIAGEGSQKPETGSSGRKAAKKKRSKAAKAGAKTATAAIEARIGHKFSDASLLTTAITHVSALKPQRKRGESYQRLEFLG
jgi:ribonuclease-3